MSESWQQARLRFGGGGPLFGWMHEDAAIEVSLLPAGGRAACVLSAGDTAFALLRSGASEVLAADPSRPQHELVRLKLAAARRGFDVGQAAACKVSEVLAGMRSAVPAQRWHGRPMLAAGSVDARLRWIERVVTPMVAGRSQERVDWQAVFERKRWRAAWSLLAGVIRVVFPPWYRQHLPADFIERVRRRFEACCLREDAGTNPHLRRLMSGSIMGEPEVWLPAWPPNDSELLDRLSLHEGTLGDLAASGPFDVVAASNILDTRPSQEAADLLAVLWGAVAPNGWLVLRSLFREAEDWPKPPPGWEGDLEQTQRLRRLDRSPFCQVSAVFRRTAM